MSLSDVVIFLAGAVGMTNIIVYSDIFHPVRDYLRPRMGRAFFLECSQCTGTWCGFFTYFLMLTPWTRWFVFGCAASFAAVMAVNILTYLEARSVIELPDDDGN